MKALRCLPVMTLALSAQAATVVEQFSGAFDVSQWAITTQGGVIDTLAAPLTVMFTGANNDSGPSEQTMLIAAPSAGFVSFNWVYETLDSAPLWDAFSFTVNGAFNPVSDDLAGTSQSGSFTIKVASGDVFGFSAQSFDSANGSASTWVSGFRFEEISAVPEPGTLPLMLVALAGGLAWYQRRPLAGQAAQGARA